MSFVSFLSQLIKAQSVQHLKYPMDKALFKEKTDHLIRWSAKEDRHVLIKNTTPRDCEYCPNQPTNQVVVCEPYRLGTDKAHFKHKCKTCNHIVFDGLAKDPYTRKSAQNLYYIPVSKAKDTPTLSRHGVRLGRPPSVEVKVKRPRGRPRKNPI